MDGNPGVIPDNVGAILLILRGRICIFPAHWRNRFAVPLEPFGLDLSCNRKYVARNDVTPRITPVQTLYPIVWPWLFCQHSFADTHCWNSRGRALSRVQLSHWFPRLLQTSFSTVSAESASLQA